MSEDYDMSPEFSIQHDGNIISFAELARALKEIDSISHSYHMDIFRKGCEQAQKNRLWDVMQAVK